MNDPQAICDEWNARYPVGTPVVVSRLASPGVEYTSSRAVPVGRRACVELEGRIGAVGVDRCTPILPRKPIVPEPTPQQACDAFNAKVKVGDAIEYTYAGETTAGFVSQPAYVEQHRQKVYVWLRFPGMKVALGHIADVRPKPKSPAQLACDAFNAKVKTGDTVEACWLCVPFRTHTVGPAIVKDGAACVFLGNCSGKFPFLLDNVRPIERAKAAEPTLDGPVNHLVKCLPPIRK